MNSREVYLSLSAVVQYIKYCTFVSCRESFSPFLYPLCMSNEICIEFFLPLLVGVIPQAVLCWQTLWVIVHINWLVEFWSFSRGWAMAYACIMVRSETILRVCTNHSSRTYESDHILLLFTSSTLWNPEMNGERRTEEEDSRPLDL